MSKAEVISNLTNIVSGLSIIRSDLSDIDRLTINLKDKAAELEQGEFHWRANRMLCSTNIFVKIHVGLKCYEGQACGKYRESYVIS